ncbi:unnamed protein product [Moneuplotes crassus]|uniref:Uncharacterized protein n=1 Tax=Euplotes crassus TaxID=5936 RepID=A0AAD1X4G3_EUPCR|nr:unnamed protein product [Moneuplotes crassus]
MGSLLKKLVKAQTRLIRIDKIKAKNPKKTISKRKEYILVDQEKNLNNQKLKTVKEMIADKDLAAAIYLENKGMTFTTDSEDSNYSQPEDKPQFRYKSKRDKTNWNKITNFVLNEDPNIFRRILRGMNNQFYEDFEDTALKAYKLDDFKPEDFKVLKKIGIKRTTKKTLQEALHQYEGSDDEFTDPFKQVRNKEETVKELIKAKTNLKNQDIVIVEKPQIYTDLINAYRKCKEDGYAPKQTFQQKIEEITQTKIEHKFKTKANKKLMTRNSIMIDPPIFSPIHPKENIRKAVQQTELPTKKVDNLTRFSIKNLFRKGNIEKSSQKSKIKYSISKFSGLGEYYKNQKNSYRSFIEETNVSTMDQNGSQDLLYEKMSEGIPFRHNKNYSISEKPTFSGSLRRSLLKPGQLRDRNQSLIDHFSQRGGSLDIRRYRLPFIDKHTSIIEGINTYIHIVIQNTNEADFKKHWILRNQEMSLCCRILILK